MGSALLAFLILISIPLYFLPSIIGFKKKNHLSILLLNIFLGWSIIGWVVALIWAVAEEESVEGGQLKKCPRCAEGVKAEAKVCRFCGYDYEKEREKETNAIFEKYDIKKV
jgi:hypothetical protein